ncbi:ankyrin repeat domain-containing protein [Aspergillus fischeri NRRL 181]|uniref:Ankyrin repeat protein n=1 Tax=Neosartorya fischeri (strain ATCC 1020 / DSM 3700 / CBS 544.65 / FGSC A1164 / JCM 1740 / NRRL 181 / WB 181) TaxID=331117 RepID=A1D5H9_NEOFI|nr:Ankyrin repeat protein [Aspergillus fischeri NRRL 181]EAW22033.1 Ankyrin repeat protein [Aspergillus fischeri NRRL 181]
MKLPLSLLQHIVEELEQASHIASLARANKQLYNVLYPYLCQFNVNQRGISAVNWAARKGNSHVIKSFLLRYEANVNVRDEDGRTPIFNAIDSQDEVTVKTLLEQKSIYLACRNCHRDTLLSYAASKDSLFAVRMLLDKGVNVNVGNCCMYTPLNWAVQHKNMDMVDTLLESLRIAPAMPDFDYERIHYSNSLSLHLAAATGDIEIIQRLLNYEYEVNTRDNRGRTPLHRAVEKGHLAVVNLFLAQPNIDINRADSRGRTPM